MNWKLLWHNRAGVPVAARFCFDKKANSLHTLAWIA